MRESSGSALPDPYHRAVRLAAGLLVDDVLHRLVEADGSGSIAIDLLPPGYRRQIEEDLFRWSVAFVSAATRLSERRPTAPTCVAEQLAMHAILTFAVDLLEDGPRHGLPGSVDRARAEEWQVRIYDELCDDTDFLFLYDPAMDGIGADPDEPIGGLLRTVNLAVGEWFLPLPGRLGHPYYGDSPDPEEDGDVFPRA